MLTCRHCKDPRTFDGRHDRHGHVIFGQAPEEQVAQATLEAVKHLQIRHPEAFEQMNAIASSVAGLSLMVHMKTDVPDAKQKEQRAAAEIVKAFGRVVTDEDIAKAIQKWKMDNPWADMGIPWEGVTSLLRQLRDTLGYADVLTGAPTATDVTTVQPNGEAVL